MLSRKLFHWMHRVALFAIVFASLAPSISHALAANQDINGFAQEICTTEGKSITIQVLTTKGQQLATELEKAPFTKSVISHLNHCPFCNNPSVNAMLEPPHAFIVAMLVAQAEQLDVATSTAIPHFTALPPPAQAPPLL